MPHTIILFQRIYYLIVEKSKFQAMQQGNLHIEKLPFWGPNLPGVRERIPPSSD